jgi:O-antigen/teichoic acid export membrane protein
LDRALKDNSATVEETAHEVNSLITGSAPATPYLRADRVGGHVLWERLWRLASGTYVIALIDQAIVSGASFASMIIVARWTVPNQLGIYSIGISLLVAAVTVQEALISLPYTILRHRSIATPAECAGDSLMQNGLFTALLVLVLAATSVGLHASRADPALATMVWALAAMAPFALLREFGRRFAFTHLRLAEAAVLDGAVATIQLGALFWLGWKGWMSSATACLALGGACAPTAAMWMYLSRRDFAFRPSQLGAAIRQSWALGKWLFGSQIALLVQGYAANWLLAWIAGAATTGIYAACMSVVSISNPLIIGISNILVPRAVLALNEGSSRKLWRQSVLDAVLLGLAMAVFCFAIAIAGETVMRMLFHGAEFEGRGQVLTVLAGALLASSLGMPATNALASMERTREIFWTVSGAAVLTTLLVWHLTSAWGLIGAAYGFLLGNVFGAAVRWTAFSFVILARVPRADGAERTGPSASLAQATQVLQEFTRGAAGSDWSVRKLDEGKQADVFVARLRSRHLDAQAQEPVVIKIYRSTVASRAELARQQFECLSRSHALLGGRTFSGWRTSAPVPLYMCGSPLALVMSMVPGRKVSWHLRSGGELTREILDTAPEAVVAGMTHCWAAGQSHGDLNVDNIILDPVARKISFVDLDLLPGVCSCFDGASPRHPASDDIAYMLYSAAMDVKEDILRPGVYARKLMFVEGVLRAYVATIAGCEDKMRVLEEIHACTHLHLKAIEVSWWPQGHWRRLLRRRAARSIDRTLETLKRECRPSQLQAFPSALARRP